MNSDLRDKISTAATAVEIVLGLIILLACVIGSIGLVCTTEMDQMLHVPEYFQERLSDACLIIIGIELIKMITSYTIDSVVDVMLLAIARQMVVEHTTPLENLLAVLSVGVLFVIRKYLYISHLDRRKRSKKDIEEDVRAEVYGFTVRRKEERAEEGRP
ncbi:phosphate-starvation-inducible PsiE family protein [uncultured Agathobaculum sp.]|uniref:phosphate-starvation-inducible PsiE family protein n=1 Tax=uncultured Agathobaculum sp. TaxID=2048140 RepID=UPI00263012B7|nr:phosphate-starvation-inducible PsiE family protein [uncultured Agathobaculum sp.]